MEKNLEKKMYNDYLNGDKKAFEYLYSKYKSKIKYFVYNIVKDYSKAEDITQETFMYIIQNPIKGEVSFKHYIYLVAKGRAYNYINVEKRRNEIKEQYVNNETEHYESDILDIITKEESKKELLESINELDVQYKNAIYLTNIEGLSYKETSEILGQTIQNTKNLIHRGKKQLRKILLKKGFDNMNKVSKVIIIVLAVVISVTGVTYAVTKIYKKYNTKHNIIFNPTYQSTIDENTINNLWIGTLDLAWKDLEKKLGKDSIEIEDEELPMVKELNDSNFSKEMLDQNDYKINVEKTVTNGYKIEATLNKELNFLETFDNFSKDYKYTFSNGEEPVKYFGINNASPEKMNKNIEVLFYNQKSTENQLSDDFAIKLKTQEGDEIILYRTNENKSFNEYYNDIKSKTSKYSGNKSFKEKDELLIPYVRVNGRVAYNDLYGKFIKGTNGLYFTDVIQNVNFSLNEKGCNLNSKATMVTEYIGISDDTKYCFFKDKFVIFMKEKDSENPYFALKVDNDDILEKVEETDEPKLIDYTILAESDKYYKKYLDGIEYKFYEDEKYEYYYPSQKTKVVKVYFKNGEIMTVEDALKQGKITMDLLDEYEVKYIRKEKHNN